MIFLFFKDIPRDPIALSWLFWNSDSSLISFFFLCFMCLVPINPFCSGCWKTFNSFVTLNYRTLPLLFLNYDYNLKCFFFNLNNLFLTFIIRNYSKGQFKNVRIMTGTWASKMGRPIAGTVDVAEPELNFRIGSAPASYFWQNYLLRLSRRMTIKMSNRSRKP